MKAATFSPNGGTGARFVGKAGKRGQLRRSIARLFKFSGPRLQPTPPASNEIFLSVPADALNCLENFYDQESDGTVTWRWTGPWPHFSLFANVPRDAAIRTILEVQDSLSSFNWQNTFAECDGVMMLCTYRAADGRHYLEGIMHARPGASGAVIRYHVQEVRRAGGGDDRMLGMRVGAIHFAKV
jgi:hypothetical protein